MSTSIGKLTEAITEELTIYNNNVIDGIKKEAKKSMDQLVKQTKATSPVGKRKRYKKSIKSKKTKETDRAVSYTWYVDGPDYRLSHLLENGHATRNGGRSKAYHFIRDASEPILKEYAKNVEEVIKNG